MDQETHYDIGGERSLSFKDIILNQFNTVVKNANVEFRGGFWTKYISKTGEERLIYIPDTRETFCNSVRILATVWKKRFQPNMKMRYKVFKKKLKELQEEFIQNTSVNETVILGENYYTNERDKILLEEYKNKKLELYLVLFSWINEDLAETNYLEIMGGTYD